MQTADNRERRRRLDCIRFESGQRQYPRRRGASDRPSHLLGHRIGGEYQPRIPAARTPFGIVRRIGGHGPEQRQHPADAQADERLRQKQHGITALPHEIEGETENGREQQGAYQRPPASEPVRGEGDQHDARNVEKLPHGEEQGRPGQGDPGERHRPDSFAGHAILEEIDRPALPERIEHLKTYGRPCKDQPRSVVQQVAQREQHRMPLRPHGPYPLPRR
mgnify:CR=1 FL=1